ncbi:MAG: branched-chain amino acid ABC transporter permease [Acidimicrobiales bacterium]
MIKLRLPAWARLPRQPLLRHLLFGGVGVLFFYLLSNSLSDFNNFELGEVAVYAIAIAGLSVLTGVNGQICLGQGAFVAVGAYTLGELEIHQSLNLVVQLLIAVIISGVVGLIIAVPATRLRGPYLAGMTLLLALALPFLSDKYSNFFGGDQGLVTLPPNAPGSIDPAKWLTWIELFCALLVMVLLANLLASRFGRSFRAVRDNEVAASLAGVHVARTKVIAFVVSSACAGLAGALLALSTGVVNTGEFPLSLSIYILAGMVLGGSGTLTGAWWGAILVVYLPNQWSQSLANDFSLNHLVGANLAVIIFGAVLIIVMLVAPAGVQGGLRWLARRLVSASTATKLAGNISVPLQQQAEPNQNRGDSESERAATRID